MLRNSRSKPSQIKRADKVRGKHFSKSLRNSKTGCITSAAAPAVKGGGWMAKSLTRRWSKQGATAMKEALYGG